MCGFIFVFLISFKRQNMSSRKKTFSVLDARQKMEIIFKAVYIWLKALKNKSCAFI